jgi:hypothetical protein
VSDPVCVECGGPVAPASDGDGYVHLNLADWASSPHPALVLDDPDNDAG